MREQKVYRVRQAVLKAFADIHPAAMNFEELADQPALAFARNATRDELLAAWDGLVANGYLSVCPGSDGQYRAANAKGLAQINQEADKDQYVWGRLVMADPEFMPKKP